MNATDFVKKHNVTVKSEWASINPHMTNSEHMNNYKSTLKHDGRQFTLYYSKGVALEGEPTADEIVLCLASDMNCIEYGLDDFIDNMGYEYREGKKVFDTIETQTQKMFKLLGFEAFQDFKTVVDE